MIIFINFREKYKHNSEYCLVLSSGSRIHYDTYEKADFDFQAIADAGEYGSVTLVKSKTWERVKQYNKQKRGA